MMRHASFVILAGIILVLCMHSNFAVAVVGDEQRPAGGLELRVEQLEERVVLLEERLTQLESAQPIGMEPGDENPALTAAANSQRIMQVTGIGKPEMDPATERKIADLNRDADEAEKRAIKAKEQADRYISRNGKSDSPILRNDDEERDAKRAEALKEHGKWLAQARKLRGEAKSLQRSHDAQTLIEGWNGEREVELVIRSPLPARCRDLVPGDFVTWNGRIESATNGIERWLATSIDRATEPENFNRR